MIPTDSSFSSRSVSTLLAMPLPELRIPLKVRHSLNMGSRLICIDQVSPFRTNPCGGTCANGCGRTFRVPPEYQCRSSIYKSGLARVESCHFSGRVAGSGAVTRSMLVGTHASPRLVSKWPDCTHPPLGSWRIDDALVPWQVKRRDKCRARVL